jgi:uracil-DNA glycosylase
MGILHFFPMYHPAVATYNPNKMSILLKDFETLYNFLEKPLINI